jgi:hypothetical protein
MGDVLPNGHVLMAYTEDAVMYRVGAGIERCTPDDLSLLIVENDELMLLELAHKLGVGNDLRRSR